MSCGFRDEAGHFEVARILVADGAEPGMAVNLTDRQFAGKTFRDENDG